MKFTAEFNEEADRTGTECEERVVAAVDAASGIELAEEPMTLSREYGDTLNISVNFAVEVDETVEDARTPKGRLNAHLQGESGPDALIRRTRARTDEQ